MKSGNQRKREEVKKNQRVVNKKEKIMKIVIEMKMTQQKEKEEEEEEEEVKERLKKK